MQEHGKIKRMAYAAVIGAAYAALTMVLAPISFGPIQMRVSEVLCVLPFFFLSATWGLFIGCMIANLISAAGVWDVVFGSLATLGSCLCIQALGQRGRGARSWPRIVLAMLMPVVWNAVIIGLLLALFYAEKGKAKIVLFFLYGAEVGVGELAVMFILGLPLMRWLPKAKFYPQLREKLDKAI